MVNESVDLLVAFFDKIIVLLIEVENLLLGFIVLFFFRKILGLIEVSFFHFSIIKLVIFHKPGQD